jgi:hypothetical protein
MIKITATIMIYEKTFKYLINKNKSGRKIKW